MDQPREQRTFALAAGALLTAALLCALVAGAGSSEAARRPGGHAHGHRIHPVRLPSGFLGLLPGPTPFNPTDAARVASTGVRRVRIGLGWFEAQRRPGPFDWTATDAMIGRLAANGIRVLPTLGGTPHWVAPIGTTAPVRSRSARVAWRAYVAGVVGRYGPGGSFWEPDDTGTSPFHQACGCDAAPVPIEAWQVWNEPNLGHYFQPRPSPRQYARLVKLTSGAIRSVDPTATVVLAGLSAGSGQPGDIPFVSFLRRFYRVPAIKQWFDAVAIHPYSRTIPAMRSDITRLRRVMSKRHDDNTPLWITEVGWGSGPRNRWGINKGPGGQRRMLRHALEVLGHKRRAWHLAHVYWFFWRDPRNTAAHRACSFCNSAGLLWNSGRPKPAYSVYRHLARHPIRAG